MKFNNFVLLVIGIGIIILAVDKISYNYAMAPTWAEIERNNASVELSIRQANAQADAETHQTMAAALAVGSWVLVGLVLAIGGTMFVYVPWHKRQESMRRAVDGMYPLQMFSNGRVSWASDIGRSLTGNNGFDHQSGMLGEHSSNYTTPDHQIALSGIVERTRTMAAKQITERPNRTSAMAEAGVFDEMRREKAAKADLALFKLSEATRLPAIGDGDTKALPSLWQPIALVDAFRQSTPDRWLLGQNEQGPCEFSIRDNIHTGLLGATGTGKTASTALLMAYDALHSGMHVIALDGKGGVDWTQHGQYLEAWPTDYTMISDQVGEIVRLHDLRMKEIRRCKVENIGQLDYKIPPMFVIMEEFGYTMQALNAANKKRHDQTENALSNLMRVSRATGIHFLLIDQSARNWPGTIKANVKAWFSYQLKGLQGNAFNAYDLHLLKPKGQFWHNDQIYDAWFTKSEVRVLQQELRPVRTKMLTNVEYSVMDNEEVTGYEKGGGFNAENPPPKSAPVIAVTVGSTRENDPVTAPVTPVLVGAPVTIQDKNKVRNIYAVTGSKSETCRLVWGGKNGQRMQWLNDILQESDVKQ